MTIQSVDMGKRQPPNQQQPKYWVSVGVSMARSTVPLDFGGYECDVECYWRRVSTSTRQSLETALASKQWQAVSCALDSGDDLGLGLSGTVSLTYVGNSYRFEHLAGDYWSVWLTLRKYA